MNLSLMNYHTTVLLQEAVEALSLRPFGVYADVTFGGGGHSRLILNQLDINGKLYAFDQDIDAQANIGEVDARFTFINNNFRHIKSVLRLEGERAIDGILADLGVSSHQLDDAARGFSYRFNAALDMRMNQKHGITAADLLNKSSAEELQRIFSQFGEVRNARTLAHALVEARHRKKFLNINDLLAISDPLSMGEKMRYRSQVFQALRMEVNDEIGALKDFLQQSLAVLKPGGRLAVITFHSIEDRFVKNFMKTGNFEGELETDFYGNINRPFKLISKKPIEPSAKELKENPRSRSAKLRIAEKV